MRLLLLLLMNQSQHVAAKEPFADEPSVCQAESRQHSSVPVDSIRFVDSFNKPALSGEDLDDAPGTELGAQGDAR